METDRHVAGIQLATQALRLARESTDKYSRCGACLVDPASGEALAWGAHRRLGRKEQGACGRSEIRRGVCARGGPL